MTDPDSRLMNTRSGYIRGYNEQLAVDIDDQMIGRRGSDPRRQ